MMVEYARESVIRIPRAQHSGSRRLSQCLLPNGKLADYPDFGIKKSSAAFITSIPIGSHCPEYVHVTPSGSDLAVTLPTCSLVTSILEEENFKRIRSNIAVLAGEEKRIQSSLAELNRRTLLDAEIAFTGSGKVLLAKANFWLFWQGWWH